MSTITKNKAIIELATKKSTEIIRHQFTDQELSEMKDAVSKNLMKLIDYEDELKEIKDEFKEKMNPIRKENKHLLKSIRNGFEDQELEVYVVPDFDNKIVEFYNEEGDKVGDRKMLISEMQGRLEL